MNPDAKHTPAGRAVAGFRRIVGLVAALLLTLPWVPGLAARPPQASAQPSSEGTTPTAVPAARQANNVAIITIEGEITEWTARSVERRMKLAEHAGADAIVFELNTPGGDVRAVLAITTMIKGSAIPNTVAWIRPQAYSGGAIIAFSTREMIASDPATMGDAIPILASPFGIQAMSESERQKLISVIVSDLVDSARRRGYDEKLVQGMVALGVELWLVRHTQTGRQLFIGPEEYRLLFGEPPPGERSRLASVPSGLPSAPAPESRPGELAWPPMDADASKPAVRDEAMRFDPATPSLEGMEAWIEGEQGVPTTRPILTEADRGDWVVVEKLSDGASAFVFQTSDMLRYGLAQDIVQNDEELKAYFGAKNLLRMDASWSEGLVAFLTSLWVRAVLIVVFIVSLFLEMTSPGLTLPGAVAMVALVLLLAPPMLINLANWWEIAAIAVGVLLIVVEIFVVPGFGIFGVAGLLALFGGLVGTFLPDGGFFPDTPAQREDLLFGVTSVVLALGTSVVLMYFVSRHFGSLPILNRLVLKDGEVDEATHGDDLLAAFGSGDEAPVRPGMLGVAITPLRPSGRAEIADRLVDVVADIGYIPAGAPVRVTSVTPFRTGVEAAGPPPEQASADDPTGEPAPGGTEDLA